MTASVSASGAGGVRRRRVFYLSGFDPQGPAHYHRLYVDQAALQQRVSGASLSVSSRRKAGAHAASWDVVWSSGGESVQTEMTFLRWDDIVRANWPRSRIGVMLGALRSTAHQVRNGVLWRVLKTSWPAFLVLAFPPLLVLGLGMSLVLATVVAVWALLAGASMAALLGFGLFLLAWWRGGAWAEQRVQMAWLMRSTRFILRQAAGQTAVLEARLDEFAAHVAAARADPSVDEVLVVGHSSGAMLAVSVVARAVAPGSGASLPGDVAACRPSVAALSLLTLGECIPMLSYQPEAEAFRGELALVATSADVEWVDVTAPPDGCCFALVDPTAAARPRGDSMEPLGSWRGPKRLSARFAQAFPAAAYERIRRDKYRCHFQYLMATERPVDYDYFSVTAGPLRLADRFAGSRSVDDFLQFQCFGGPGS